jgi:hypothetical protein
MVFAYPVRHNLWGARNIDHPPRTSPRLRFPPGKRFRDRGAFII